MPEPLRILYINNSADTYGASRTLLRLCAGLDRTMFEPFVVLPEDGPLRPLLNEAGIQVLIQKFPVMTREVYRSWWRLLLFLINIPIAAGKLRAIIRQRRVYLVHSNVGVIPSPALAARWAKVAHVWHIRDWYGEFRTLWKWYHRYILNFSDQVLCVSRAVADQFPTNSKVQVIHDGFELENFEIERETSRAAFLRKYNVDPKSPVILCVGRIKWKRKGQEFLVRAAALLRDAGKVFSLVIVGDTSAGNEHHLVRLRALVKDLNLQDRVVFTGKLSDPRPAYAACDVFVLPSAQPEPFGGVVVEAMCMAKPVVATAIGGSPDQVVDGETGYLVPAADPHALAEKLQMLLDDSALRLRMGEAGLQQARKLFATKNMVEKIEAIYREFVGR